MNKLVSYIAALTLLGSLMTYSCTKDKVTVLTPLDCPDTISFSAQVLPLIQSNCTGCHNVGNGTGYLLTNHSNISASANAILGSMHADGYQLMPQGGPALPDSLILKVACWIDQGKKNN
jgi:hypothetical protein